MTMYIVRDKTTGIVAYLSEQAMVLDENGLHGAVRALDIRPETHEIVEADGPEQAFVPGVMAYDNGWAIVDQDGYDALLAELTPPPKPPDLNRRKFRLGLFHAGLLDAVDAAIDTLPEPERSIARIEFDDGDRFVRTDPWVATLAQVMSLSDAEIDALWTWAAGL